MAGDHKSGGGDSSADWLWALIAIVAVGVVVYGLGKPFDPTFLNLEYLFGGVFRVVQAILGFLFYNESSFIIRVLITGICVLFVVLIFYLIIRLLEMEKEHRDHAYHSTDHLDRHSSVHESAGLSLHESPELARAHFEELEKSIEDSPGQPKWEIVLDHISSQNESDWRMAIIEADTLLDTMIEGQGYPGATLGERLTNAGQGAFKTYSDAWEAHKVRNNIAHQGVAFELTYREAKHTIDRYENVFREFDYI